MARMAIVGCEASGKTVFMSALTDHFRAADDSDRPCLVPESSAANRFAAFAQRQLRVLRQWPPATNPGKTVELDWTLRRDGETVGEIRMLEFGGETFRAAFRGEGGEKLRTEAVRDLTDYLSAADIIVVLVSLKDLFRDPGSLSAEEFERDTEALWVTRGLLDFAHKHRPDARVVIALTQADRYRNELETGGGAERVFAERWPSIRAVAAHCPVVAVASVSATDDEGRPQEGFSTEGVRTVTDLLDFAPSAPAPAAPAPQKEKRPVVRRVFLLAALLAAAIVFLSDNLPEPDPYAGMTIACCPPVAEPTNVVETVTEPVAEPTNVVETVAESVPEPKAPSPDQKRAQAVFEKRRARAEKGDIKCKRWLAHQYYGGSDIVERDTEKARDLYREAAEGGDAAAMYYLGVMLSNGEGGPQDRAEAHRWAVRAKTAGCTHEGLATLISWTAQ